MKIFLISGLMMAIATLTIAPLTRASQANMKSLAADLNGDGTVTLIELQQYNRDHRGDNHS